MAANPIKGEVDLVAGDKTYTLCFTSNAIVQVERLLEVKSISEANMGSYDTLRTMLWASLQKHHPALDLLGAGDVMDECEGGLAAIGDPLARALRFRVSRTPIDAPLEEPT